MILFAPEPGGREAFDAFMRGLLVADWGSTASPMRFSSSLAFSDLAEAPFFQNARLLLAALDEAGGTLATATGNLNRGFVRQMFDRMVLPKLFREMTLRYSKVLNEQDVWSLHIARIVSECAGLVARRKKRFQITQAGRALLPEAQAGVLFRKLFLAYFRKFDLHYDFFLRDVPGIQETLAVILWRLDNLARDWTPISGLASQVLLPGVLEELHTAMAFPHDTEEWILSGYVLEPLLDLGLVERASPSEWPRLTDKDKVRVSALWLKFVHFDHWSGGRR
jgi:hypothetical protein